jgi:predicted PurR-regulated permease PerM
LVTEIRLSPRLAALLAAVLVVWLVQQIVPILQSVGDILLLFFLAWLLAFILEPLVTIQEKLRVPRILAVALVYSALLFSLALIGVLIAPPVVVQLGQLREDLPGIVAQLPSPAEVTRVLSSLGLPVGEVSQVYSPEALAQQVQASAGDLLQRAIALAASALTLLVNVLLVLIISFYMLLDGRRITRSAFRLLPVESRANAILVLDQISANFGGFLRGQVIQATLFALVVAATMIALRMPFVAVSAVSSAALMLIPLVGPVLALAPPLGVAVFQPQADFLLLLIVLFIVQFVIVNVLMPRILSGQMGMPPLIVFLSILLGLRIGGPLGAFFGIPIMGVVYGTASVLVGRWKNGDDDRRGGADAAEPPPGAA